VPGAAGAVKQGVHIRRTSHRPLVPNPDSIPRQPLLSAQAHADCFLARIAYPLENPRLASFQIHGSTDGASQIAQLASFFLASRDVHGAFETTMTGQARRFIVFGNQDAVGASSVQQSFLLN